MEQNIREENLCREETPNPGIGFPSTFDQLLGCIYSVWKIMKPTKGYKQKGYFRTYTCACVLSCFSLVWLFVTLWTVAYQVPLFMGFSKQVYWSGLPCPSPGNLPDLGIKLISFAILALVGGFLTTAPSWKLGA